MKNLAKILFVAVMCAGSLAAQDDPIKVVTEEIKLNISAFDLNGKNVNNVNKEDLVIVEDDRLHQPDSVQRMPANVLILMDTGGKMRLAKDISLTRKVAKQLVNSLAQQDSIALMDYSDAPRVISEWTTDRAVTNEALDKKLEFGNRSTFVDALKLAKEMLEKSGSVNRHLILISEGTDSEANDAARKAALRDLLSTNINVHVISYTRLEGKLAEKRAKTLGKSRTRSLPAEVAAGMPPGIQGINGAAGTGVSINLDRKMAKVAQDRARAIASGEDFLRELATKTSGTLIVPEDASEMIDKAKSIPRVIDSNFVVTYTPRRALEESPEGEERVIEVNAKKNGLRISARRVLVVSHKKD